MESTTMNGFMLYSLLDGGHSSKTNTTNNQSQNASTFNTSVESLINNAANATQVNDLEINRSNFIWPEDPEDELPIK